MTNRVLIGKKGSAYGIWISKPGYDVLSASLDQMLLSSERTPFMVIGQGVVSAFTDINQTRALTIPNLGFRPIFLLGCPAFEIDVIYNSITSITFKSVSKRPYHSDGSCYYAYLTEPF